MTDYKFNWASVAMGEDVNHSKYAALYWYCSDYHTGLGSWQCDVLNKSRYTPGPCHKDILDTEDYIAIQYYQHLLRLFEKDVCDIDLMIDEVGTEVNNTFWNETHDITISMNGTWGNQVEFARDVYQEIISCDWGYQVSLVDVFTCLGGFHYPLSIDDSTDEDIDEEGFQSLWLGFNWWNKPEEEIDSCSGCIYFNGDDLLLRCAVSPLSTERCIEYETA